MRGPALDTVLWNDPDLKAAPTAFRAALRVVETNWDSGSVTWILPTGKVVTIAGAKPGPEAIVRINDYNFMRRAFAAGTIGFAALFHLVGAVFRRPAVFGLVYIFFFETLVANLPGSLKQLSLNYYVKSLLYNEATAAVTTATPESLDVYAPADPVTAWITLLAAAGRRPSLRRRRRCRCPIRRCLRSSTPRCPRRWTRRSPTCCWRPWSAGHPRRPSHPRRRRCSR